MPIFFWCVNKSLIVSYLEGGYNLLKFVFKKDYEFKKMYDHVEKFIGKPDYINIDTVTDDTDVSLFTFLANNKRPYHTIITAGMSGNPTLVPYDQDVWKYTELMIYLPKSWPVSKEAIKTFEQYWPIGWLRKLSKFPQENKTWFCWGDTIPNGEPPQPFARNTDFCCMLLLPPIQEDETFFKLQINKNKTIRYLVVVPIYKEEMEFKIKHGYEQLLQKFDANNISDLININRINTCK